MCSKISGTCFFWRFWAPQAAQHTRTLLGDPKSDKKTTKSNKSQQKTMTPIGYMFQISSACFFGVLKRRRQCITHAPCWETPKPAERPLNITKLNKKNKPDIWPWHSSEVPRMRNLLLGFVIFGRGHI